jgi:hypothetical protein
LVGDSLDAILEQIAYHKEIEGIHVCNEEADAFAAWAQTHLTGELAVCAGSCGPGNVHLVNGLFDCHRSRVPVLAIAAQIPSNEIGSSYFQAHGGTYLTLKTDGSVHDRSEKLAKCLWIAAVPLSVIVLVESRIVRPDLPGRALSNPFWWLGLVITVASIVALVSGLSGRRERRAFLGSNFLIVGLLATGAAAIFPVMPHSTLAPGNSLTAYAVASAPSTLLCASFWWPVGFALRFSISCSSRAPTPEK